MSKHRSTSTCHIGTASSMPKTLSILFHSASNSNIASCPDEVQPPKTSGGDEKRSRRKNSINPPPPSDSAFCLPPQLAAHPSMLEFFHHQERQNHLNYIQNNDESDQQLHHLPILNGIDSMRRSVASNVQQQIGTMNGSSTVSGSTVGRKSLFFVRVEINFILRPVRRLIDYV